jgi:hypothetical protein
LGGHQGTVGNVSFKRGIALATKEHKEPSAAKPQRNFHHEGYEEHEVLKKTIHLETFLRGERVIGDIAVQRGNEKE